MITYMISLLFTSDEPELPLKQHILTWQNYDIITTTLIVNQFEQLPQLFIEAVTQSRLNFKT